MNASLANLPSASIEATPLLLPLEFDAATTALVATTTLVPVQGDGKPAPLPSGAPGGGAGTGAAPAGGGGLGGFLPFLVIGVVFWFLIIGPERKNKKKREEMLSNLKKGDKVMTNGGLYGKIAELRENIVVLDTGDVRLKFARAAIQGTVDGDD
ncbi:MAG: preprotein translocase subunit YajC [Planctomycetota bacterium]